MASVHVNVLVALSHSFQCPHPFSFFFSYLILLFFLNSLSFSLPLFFFLNFTLPRSLSYLLTYSLSATFVPFSFLYSLPQIHFRIPSRSPMRSTFTRTPDHPLRPPAAPSGSSLVHQNTRDFFSKSFSRDSLIILLSLNYIDNEGGGGEIKITNSTRNAVETRTTFTRDLIFFFFLRSEKKERERG